MPRLTVTEVAARVGVHKSTVSRQARAANLVGADGLIDLDAYAALRATGVDPALQTTARPIARIQPTEDGGPAGDGAIAAERLRKMRLENEAAEEARQLRRGELIEAARVEADTEDAFRRLRDVLMELPRDVAEDCARLGDATAIEARLTQALKAKLREASALLTAEAPLVDAA